MTKFIYASIGLIVGFIAGALLVIGANSFDKVVAVHVIAPIQTLQPMEVGE